MAKIGKTTVVPKLRFPEFREAEEWDLKNGDELFDAINNKSPSEALPILAITQEHGAIPRDKIDYHVSVTEQSIESYKVVEKGDFIISLRSFQGGIEYSSYRGICSPAYVILRRKGDGSDGYFRSLFKSVRFIRQLTRNIEGLRDGKMISYKQFSEQRIPVAKPLEQQKIADCLSSLDELIAAQGRKVEALKSYTRGLMQQIFPRTGETQPRLRFPEFRNAPGWEPTTLNGLVRLKSGGTPSKANPEFWNGSIPWVSAKDMKRLFLDDSEDHISAAAVNDGAKMAPAGSVLVLARGMTLLKEVPICVLRREMSFNQDVKALLPKGDTYALFVALLLRGNKQRLLKMVDIAGHGTGKLNTDELNSFELSKPTSIEQHQIADFLSALDTLISIEAEKLASFKTHKDGLMQQLFPSLEDK
ncbi:restriction endonuclease subunit S [Aeromonas sp. FDAARGOS 1410]|uniref:restriction endonuclease subunit S n=1 Tax=Aeromonas TaxID=642 RepID=UPI001C21E15B|nr:restriction endonuclease subunit S [Aeromonas sp. FDAARGOS 1410]QXC39432.1 restriction endonuclease subunit S [Aeromonas sp. FDAARGOS 1410]